MNDNPMHPAQRLQSAPRCTATAKSTRKTCKAPAVNGWAVCRMHGARGGAPFGPANGRWTGGARTNEMSLMRALIASLAKSTRETASMLAI
jgi:hypothetical protein